MKKTGYVCPTCHTRGPRSVRMQMASLSCCSGCSSFARAANAPKPFWFCDGASLAERKRSNLRFPRAGAMLMREVIRTTHSEGKYSGPEIVSTLNKILRELNERLLHNVRRSNMYSIAFSALRILDELYYRAASAEWQLAQESISLTSKVTTADTKVLMQQTGMIGQPWERVCEAALTTVSRLSSPCTKQGLLELFELAYEMAQVHYCIESFLCLWRKGTLHVADSDWHFEPEAEDQNRFQNLLENLAIERSQKSRESLNIRGGDVLSPREFQEALQELMKGEASKKPTRLGDDLDEFILAVDGAHRDQFDHSFIQRLLGLFCLGQRSTELPGDWAFEEKVIAFLQKRLDIEEKTARSILNVLALTGEGVAQEKSSPFHFRRKFRLMRRPLLKLAVGNRFVYFLSNSFTGRGAINLFAEYMNGSHPELEGSRIQMIAQQLNQRNANYFVSERVAKPLREQGLVVKAHVKRIGKWNLAALKIGEIDILALKPGLNKLIVGEGKFSALHDVHVRQMRRDLTDYLEESKGYADKLRHKAEWVTQHMGEVLGYMEVEAPHRGTECMPIFFTNLYSPTSEFVTDIPFVREHDIAAWCQSIR